MGIIARAAVLVSRAIGVWIGKGSVHVGIGAARGAASTLKNAIRIPNVKVAIATAMRRLHLTPFGFKRFVVTGKRFVERHKSLLTALGVGVLMEGVYAASSHWLTKNDMSKQDEVSVKTAFYALRESEMFQAFVQGLREAVSQGTLPPEKVRAQLGELVNRLGAANEVLHWFYETATPEPEITPSEELLGSAILLPHQFYDATDELSDLTENQKVYLTAVSAYIEAALDAAWDPSSVDSSNASKSATLPGRAGQLVTSTRRLTVEELEDKAKIVDQLERLLGIYGTDYTGRSKLAKFLALRDSVAPNEVDQVYETRRELRRR